MALASRISLSLSRPQIDYLQREADRLGIGVADIIRRILDQHLATLPAPARPERRESRSK
jgi:hypothetical protein